MNTPIPQKQNNCRVHCENHHANPKNALSPIPAENVVHEVIAMQTLPLSDPHLSQPVPPVPAWTTLRLGAALWILVYHFGQRVWPIPVPVQAGIPVSFFFFLSGFVLAYAFQHRDVNFPSFLVRRWARLGPLYLFALLLSFLLACPWGALDRVTLLPWLVRFEVNALAIQTWIPDFALSLNPQSWAVSVELTLYVLFPLLLPCVSRTGSHRRWIFFAAIWLISALLFAWIRGVIWSEWFYSEEHKFVHHLLLYHPLMYLPVFVLGMVAAPDHFNDKRFPFPRIGFWSALFVIALSALMPHRPGWRYLLHMGVLSPAYAILLYSVRENTCISRCLSWPLLVLLGTSSYAVYIFQHPVAKLFDCVVASWQDTLCGFAGYVLCLVVIGLLLARYVERPLRYWILAHATPSLPRTITTKK